MAKTVDIHAPTGKTEATPTVTDYVTVVNEAITPIVLQRLLSADPAGRGDWQRCTLVRGVNRVPRDLWEHSKGRSTIKRRLDEQILREGAVISGTLKTKILTNAPADPTHAAVLACKSAKINARGPIEALNAEQLESLAGAADVFTQFGGI